MKRTKLFFITSEFPYGNGETFIENEIEHLSNNFENIILYSLNNTFERRRTIPENCIVYRTSTRLNFFEKITSLMLLFNKTLRDELSQLSFNSFGQLKGQLTTALLSLRIAINLKEKIISILGERNVEIDEDLVFYSYWLDDSAIALALLKQELPRIKVVSRTHRWDLYTDQSKFDYLPFRPLLFSRLDTVFPISNHGKAYLKNKFKANNLILSRLGTINNSIKNKTKVKKEKVFLVSCSLVIARKRLDLIIDALALIDINKQIKWVHFGDGPDMPLIEERIRKKSLKQTEVVFYGNVPNRDILNYYRTESVDLFLNVSDNEGVPVSIMEAFSFGIPSLARDVGANKELVDETTGFLLNRNCTPIDIANSISQYAIMDENKINELRKNAFDNWNKNFNADSNYPEFISEIQK